MNKYTVTVITTEGVPVTLSYTGANVADIIQQVKDDGLRVVSLIAYKIPEEGQA